MAEHCAVKAEGRSHQGLVREQNEDRYVIDQSIGCYLVADGMGGHQAGEVASKIAAELISKKIALGSQKKVADPAKFLREAILTAHQAIRKQAHKNISQHGMGSTVVVAWLQSDSCQLWLAHVGDSRAYLQRGGELFLLTEDHTIYNQARRAGLLGPDPQTHPPRGVLSQALGPSEVIAPDITRIELQLRDRLLLCSDGLTDMLSEEQISSYLHDSDEIENACLQLIQAALDQGGKDNVSVVILQVEALNA